MYNSCMEPASALSVSEARENLASVVARAQAEHEPVYLSRHGKRVAAVIDADDLDHLIALAEDMSDILAAEEAREEMRRTMSEPIPMDELMVELGLK